MPNTNIDSLSERQGALDNKLVAFLNKVPNHTVEETNEVVLDMVSNL